jgi:sialate O-acetylesterase
VGGGHVSKDGPLKGFTIAGGDKHFVEAKAEIQGDTVVVTSDRISSPVSVRYGFTNVPDGNLWNKDGLPASTFRTDPESMTQDTQPSKKQVPTTDTPET